MSNSSTHRPTVDGHQAFREKYVLVNKRFCPIRPKIIKVCVENFRFLSYYIALKKITFAACPVYLTYLS